jgi:hypothetical protein
MNPENHRKFLNGVASDLGIVNPKQWGQVTCQEVIERGGGTLLAQYYKNSLFSALSSIYRGIC